MTRSRRRELARIRPVTAPSIDTETPNLYVFGEGMGQTTFAGLEVLMVNFMLVIASGVVCFFNESDTPSIQAEVLTTFNSLRRKQCS